MQAHAEERGEWGDYVLGAEVANKGERGTLFKASRKDAYASRVMIKVSPLWDVGKSMQQEYEVCICSIPSLSLFPSLSLSLPPSLPPSLFYSISTLLYFSM